MEKETRNAVTRSQARNHARRRLIKSLVAGGGAVTTTSLLPTAWSRPVLDIVALPAHAQATPGEEPDPFGDFEGLVGGASIGAGFETYAQSNGLSKELLAFFAPVAEASHANCTTNIVFMTAAPGSGATAICDGISGFATTVVDGANPTCGGGTLPSGHVLGGVFEDPNWRLTFSCSSNVTFDVTMVPGGPGCSPD
jgi:hypothetical protein